MLQKRNKKKGRGGVHSDVMNDRERDALLKNFKDVELCKSRPPVSRPSLLPWLPPRCPHHYVMLLRFTNLNPLKNSRKRTDYWTRHD